MPTIKSYRVYMLMHIHSVFYFWGGMMMFERIKIYLRKKKFEYKHGKFCKEWLRKNKNWNECRHKRKAFKRDVRRWMLEYKW